MLIPHSSLSHLERTITLKITVYHDGTSSFSLNDSGVGSLPIRYGTSRSANTGPKQVAHTITLLCSGSKDAKQLERNTIVADVLNAVHAVVSLNSPGNREELKALLLSKEAWRTSAVTLPNE